MNPIPFIGQVIEALREEFVYGTPLGGAVKAVEHRPGADIALDGLFDDGCAGIVWVNLIRLFRTTSFPAEEEHVACRGALAAVVQIGAARCVATLDDAGFPPSPEDSEHDALVGIDDALRLERAACRAVRLSEDLNLIHGAVWSASEPIGPSGGALAWVKTITVHL